MNYEYRFFDWSRAVEVATQHARTLGHARIVRDRATRVTRWVLTFDGWTAR